PNVDALLCRFADACAIQPVSERIAAADPRGNSCCLEAVDARRLARDEDGAIVFQADLLDVLGRRWPGASGDESTTVGGQPGSAIGDVEQPQPVKWPVEIVVEQRAIDRI